jgi:hypothetical protein
LGADKEAHLKKLSIAVVLAVLASFAFASVASANNLRYSKARSLAIALAQEQERKDPVERWRIFGAERTSPREIVWVYNVDYSDGRLCDAELVVRHTHKTRRSITKAFFRDIHCE